MEKISAINDEKMFNTNSILNKEKDVGIILNDTNGPNGAINEKMEIKENRQERGHWGNYFEFILSCIGFSVGIGNVWRFPYVCYENGGGAFLIPFFLILLMVGLPFYFMELGLGQFTRLGPPGCFNLAPLTMGVGVAMLIVSAITGIFYNVVMAYTLFYTFASFQKRLPWTHCNGIYNTKNCFVRSNALPANNTLLNTQNLTRALMLSAASNNNFIMNNNNMSNLGGNTYKQMIDDPQSPYLTNNSTLLIDSLRHSLGETGVDNSKKSPNVNIYNNQNPFENKFDSPLTLDNNNQSGNLLINALKTYLNQMQNYVPHNKQSTNNDNDNYRIKRSSDFDIPLNGDSENGKGGTNNRLISSSEEYWIQRVLDIKGSTGMHQLGKIKWELALCLLLSWSIVFLTLCKGISSAGKAIYFTATFPYLILTILLIKGVTLQGARQGIIYFLRPQWDKLAEIKVWREAAGQVFFSLSVGFGGIIAFSSFNTFNNNCHRDAWIVSLADTFTSMISGFVIFSVMGHMSDYMGSIDPLTGKFIPLPIDQVVQSGGPGLAFIAYPEALSRFYPSQLWTVMFFIMLFMLGLNSEVAYIETILSALHDNFPRVFPWKYKTWVCLAACVIGFLCGLPCVTQGGQFVIKFLDHFGSNFMVVGIGLFEVIGIMWIYGFKQFIEDLQTMLGKRIPLRYYWMSTWVFIAPVMLAIIFAVSLMPDSIHLRYGEYHYHTSFQVLGWLIVIIGLGQIPLWAYINTAKQPGISWKQKINNARQPTPEISHVQTVQRNLFSVNSDLEMDKNNVILHVAEQPQFLHTFKL